jgi:broad specificity phosphatase PhoE
MVATRWERWLHHVRGSDGGDVVAVTHAGVIRVALARGSQGSSALEAHIPFGSVHRLDLG